MKYLTNNSITSYTRSSCAVIRIMDLFYSFIKTPYNNYVKNDADFNDLKNQDYYCAHGFDFIMLVTGLIHSRLNEAVKTLGKSSVSTIDMMIKAGHMRMVKHNEKWQLHNTRTKDIELLESIGFTPSLTYPEAI